MATVKSGKKTMGIWSIVCILVILVCSLFLFIGTQKTYASDTKKVTGTFKFTNSLTNVTFKEADMKPVKVTCNHFVLNSTDPTWNNATYYATSFTINPDSAMGGNPYRVYGVITHPGGDQMFIEAQESLKEASEGYFDWAFETEGLIIGGTGKFERLRAIWKYKGKGLGLLKALGEWEVEYYSGYEEGTYLDK